MTNTPHTFYEFFAGGGMARAGLGARWECLFANDFSAKKAESYVANWGAKDLLVEDVNRLTTKHLPEHADLIWGSFPCQDLSLAGAGAGLDGERSGSFWGFWKLVQRLNKQGRKPHMVVLENVYGALTSHDGEDFAAIIRAVASEGYRVGAMVIDAVHFVPQSRPRLFIIGVDAAAALPATVASTEANLPNALWHPPALVEAFHRLPAKMKQAWLWWNLPAPKARRTALADIVEPVPVGVEWHSAEETAHILEMMTALNRNKILAAQQAAKASNQVQVGAIYRRTRGGVQRAEVRFDGISGCLRTPTGGSSRQTLVILDGKQIRTRLLSPREAARLMGLPDSYVLPARYNDAYHLAGDGVVVPVVAHLAKHLLTPIAEARTLSPENVRETAAA
jgi:DNA (cytosine-5)-methyltransferase 1